MPGSIKSEKVVGSFRARSDDGREYVVIEIHGYVEGGPNLGDVVVPRTPTYVRYVLDDGTRLQPERDPGTFKIIELDEIIRKV